MVITKASRATGMIFRMFFTRSMIFLSKLFNAYVLPILKYASPVWNPAGVGKINDVERVLRRFSKRLPVLRSLSYEKRLERLGMCSLQDRRRLADVIIAFKALHGLLGILPSNIGVTLSELSTRGGGCNLIVSRVSTTRLKQSYNFRIAHVWNNLPRAAKQAPTLRNFKNKFK
jgi:hypothetical protein